MFEKRYFKSLDGLVRIKRAVNRYRSPDDPPSPHEISALDLVETLARWSVHPDLKWASDLLIKQLWGDNLCTQSPIVDGKAVFTVECQVVAEAFRAIAARKKRN